MATSNSLNRLFFTISIIVYITALLLYGFWNNFYNKKIIIEHVDTKLYNNAISLKYILPDDFHDRAIDAQSVSINEDKYIARKLTSLVKEAGFKYTYTIIKKDDKLFFIASDIIADPENERGTFFYHEYEEADEIFINAFEKKTPTYRTVTDQWGTVRTVIVPEKSPGGTKYLACVDYDISYVKGLIQKNLIQSTAPILFFLLLAVPIIKIYTNSYREFLKNLKESEKKYRHLFQNAPAGIYEIDFEKVRFINVNEVMCKYSGYSEEEFLSMNPLDLLTEDSKNSFIRRLEKLSTGENQISSIEYNIIKKNGQKLCVILNNDYIYENGKLTGARVVVHDITEFKKAEKEKIDAQKIAGEQKKFALVGQISGKMAHDFNNILGIIMGNTELSLMDCKDEETKKTLELIFEQTLRGKNLTRNLVAFAKDQEPKQEFFKINEKVELVLNLLKKDLEGIDAIKDEGHGVPDLLADPGMIEHALVNLVQNSIHAISMVEQPKIIIRTFHQDKNIEIEIEDNGCGIPDEAIDIIYEPAFTMKGSRDITNSYKPGIKGTGYGMANVKKYIEQHKGNILIDSKVGKGTKITISLPVIKKELTQKEIIEIQKENFYSGKYILIVEDEQAISDVQYKILTHEPCDHKVDIAANGQMAVDLFDRNKYDFVSLDHILPGELNGMDVYKHIRQTNDTLPILFVSGNLDFLESIKELKNQDPYIDHVSKPCQNKDYVNAINALLEKT